VSIRQPPSRDVEAGLFVLGKPLPVVPARLTKKILKGEYVDMAELLKDSMDHAIQTEHALVFDY